MDGWTKVQETMHSLDFQASFCIILFNKCSMKFCDLVSHLFFLSNCWIKKTTTQQPDISITYWPSTNLLLSIILALATEKFGSVDHAFHYTGFSFDGKAKRNKRQLNNQTSLFLNRFSV